LSRSLSYWLAGIRGGRQRSGCRLSGLTYETLLKLAMPDLAKGEDGRWSAGSILNLRDLDGKAVTDLSLSFGSVDALTIKEGGHPRFVLLTDDTVAQGGFDRSSPSLISVRGFQGFWTTSMPAVTGAIIWAKSYRCRQTPTHFWHSAPTPIPTRAMNWIRLSFCTTGRSTRR